MVGIFINVLAAAGTICTALGLFVLFKTLVQTKRPPMDSSNRLNHLRLVWFALNAPHQFAKLLKPGPGVPPDPDQLAFPWLRRDEGDNV